LALATGQLPGLALQQRVELQRLRHLGDAARYFLARDPAFASLQAETDVLGDREMREQRVGLEHHGDLASRRRDIRVTSRSPIAIDAADVTVFEPRDHPQHGRLAAARRPDEDDEFAMGYLKIDAVDDLGRAEGFGDDCRVSSRAMGYPFTAPMVMPLMK
jgi:hypothetical protein